ncbi:MAG: IPT/TIG domain-containing protein [Phycisphaerales bacterium]|nr:MAG: IPT/TIG domain-containing protein [Phycisphaerales bacterium]
MERLLMIMLMVGCAGINVSAGGQAGPDDRPAEPVATTGSRNGPINVLYYCELDQGPSAYQQALTDLGWLPSTSSTSSPTAFAGLIASGAWTHVISNHSATSAAAAFETPLADFALANPDAVIVISDWRINTPRPYLATLGFAYGGNADYASISPVEGELFDGLPAAAIADPGWGSLWAVETAGGTQIATSSLGGGAVQQNGNWFFNGPLGDAFADVSIGSTYVQRELLVSTGVSVTTVSPVQHDYEGGTQIVVRGSGFTPGLEVTINDAALADLTWVNSNAMTGLVPANPVGTYDLVVGDSSSGAVLAILPDGVEYVVRKLPPPEDVEAVRVPTGVRLKWSNPTFNDLITVKRNTVFLDELAGDATEYFDDLGYPPSAGIQYEIITTSGVRTSTPADVMFAPYRQDCLPFLPTGGSGRASHSNDSRRLVAGIESQMCFHLDTDVEGLGFRIRVRRIRPEGVLKARIRSADPPHLVLGEDYDGIFVGEVPNDSPMPVATLAILEHELEAGDYIVGFYTEGFNPDHPSSFELLLDGFPEDPGGDCPSPNYPLMEIFPYCDNLPPSIGPITKTDPYLGSEDLLDMDRFGGRMPVPARTYTLTAEGHDADGRIVKYDWLIGYSGPPEEDPRLYQQYWNACNSNGNCEYRADGASNSILHEFPFAAYWTVSVTATDDAGATNSVSQRFSIPDHEYPNAPCGTGPRIEDLSHPAALEREEFCVPYVPAIDAKHEVDAPEVFTVTVVPAKCGDSPVPTTVEMELALPGEPDGLAPEEGPDSGGCLDSGQCWWFATFNMSALPYAEIVELRVTAIGEDGHQTTKVWDVPLCPLPRIFDYDDHEVGNIDTTLTYKPEPRQYDLKATIPDVLILDESFRVPVIGAKLDNILDAHLEFNEILQDRWWTPQKLHGRLQATLLDYDLFPTKEFDLNLQDLDVVYACDDYEIRYGPQDIPIYSHSWAWEVFNTTLWEGFVGPVHVRVKGSLDVGMDLNISADIKLIVRVVEEAGEPVVEILVVSDPSITAWAAGEIRVEVFWGLASASVRLRPSITIELPIELTSAIGETLELHISVSECFTLALDVKIRACAFGCVSSGWIPLFSESLGEGCDKRIVAASREVDDEPSDLKYPSIATSPDGSKTMAVFVNTCLGAPGEHLPELYYSLDTGAGYSVPAPLYSPADEFTQRDSNVVFLSNTKALAVWTEGTLTHAEELALPQTPQGGNTGFKNQEILCAVWDEAGGWGAAQALTDDTTPNPLIPDGRPVVAPILNNVAHPDAAWVAWVRSDNEDMIYEADVGTNGPIAGDAILSGMSIYAREILAGAPSGGLIKISAGDETDPAADIQPAVAVSPSGDVAAIIWVRDDDSDFDTALDRYLMYSVWFGAGWSAPQAATFPTVSPGVLMPSIALSSDDDGMLAFTVRDVGTNGEILGEGNKDIVYTMELRDGLFQNPVALKRPPIKSPDEDEVRPVYGRDPQVRYLDASNVTVVFRSFDGFGRRGGDGEVGVATIDLSQPDAKWSPARDTSDDEARDWDIAMAVRQDGLMRTVRDSTTNGVSGFCGLVFEDIACTPDLEVERIRLSDPHAPPGSMVTLTAVLRNSGLCTCYDTAPHDLLIGRVVDGVFEQITAPVPFTFNVAPDRIHTVSYTFMAPVETTHLRVIAEPVEGETDHTNNSEDVILGVLPPTDLQCTQIVGVTPPIVRLDWTNSEIYDSLAIYRNGRQLRSIRGSRTAYLDTTVGPGDHEWSVRAEIGSGVSDPEGAVCALTVVRPGDYDTDGDVDLDDYLVFADCMAGPDTPPSPSLPGVTEQDCLDAFDFEPDDDVDLADFAGFARVFTGG